MRLELPAAPPEGRIVAFETEDDGAAAENTIAVVIRTSQRYVNEWADANRIIVLYPQAHATTVAELTAQNFLSPLNTNPQGCWNWWGYSDDARYLTRQGVQIDAIWSMVRRVTGQGN